MSRDRLFLDTAFIRRCSILTTITISRPSSFFLAFALQQKFG